MIEKFRKTAAGIGEKWSISRWVLILFLAVLLPFNLLMLIIAKQYVTSVRTISMNSGKSVTEIYAQAMDNQMDAMENYLFTLSEDDENFIKAAYLDTAGMGRLAYYNVYRSMFNQLMVNGLDGLFFLCKEEERTMAAGASTAALNALRPDAEAFAKDKDERMPDGRWKLSEVNGSRYLTLEHETGFLYYGAMIPLEHYLEKMEDSLDVAHVSLSVDRERQAVPEGMLGISTELRHSGIYINLLTSTRLIAGGMAALIRVEYILAFLSLLAIPLLYSLLKRILISPMEEISRSLTEIESADDVTGFRISRSFHAAEINHVARAINHFVDRIGELKIESYEKELEKQRIREENIMLQVRPHFLLNLFHLIHSMAQIRNYEGIQKVALYMSKYFRELFISREKHMLSAELEVVRGYVGVLEIQYPERFSVNYVVEEEALAIQIPVLMLHSFMENIAKYAIRMEEHTSITVSAAVKEGMLYMTVADDGPGIRQDILQEINEGRAVEKQDGRHIGLSNLKQRLKLLYGADATMQVMSYPDKGTVVEVRVPEDVPEGEDGDEGSAG